MIEDCSRYNIDILTKRIKKLGKKLNPLKKIIK